MENQFGGLFGLKVSATLFGIALNVNMMASIYLNKDVLHFDEIRIIV